MDIPFHKPFITEDEIQAVVDTLRKGWITMGKLTQEFETLFGAYIGARQAVAVNSATAALHLALDAIGLKAGDEVIIPSMTFTATAEVVRYFRGIPVLVDIERGTHLIDPARIEEKITSRTKAIIPVSYGGQPCDMDEIQALADKYHLAVIEDAAHTIPAWYKNRRVGKLADLTCFSFYATKTLTTGEGGMITTENDEWADRIRIMRLHGISKDAWKRYSKEGTWEYDVIEAGYKYNTTDINAALGIAQLKKVEDMWRERDRIVNSYAATIAGNECFIPYEIKPDRISAQHLFPLRLNLEALTIDRNQFIQELGARDIHASVHFIPLYRFTYYRSIMGFEARYPDCDWVYERTISLPVYPGLTRPEIDYVAGCVLDIARTHKR